MSSISSPSKAEIRRRNSLSVPLKYANNKRIEGLNDVTIVSGDTSIPANRMVLSCYCSFFDQLFMLRENNQEDNSSVYFSGISVQTSNQINGFVVNIPDVDGKSLELIIDFIYTGQICIDSDNVLDILAAAHCLKLNEVKQYCFEFLEHCITPDSCITVLIAAKTFENIELRNKVYEHISDNYEAITQTPAFLNLDSAELFFIVYHLKTKFDVNDAVLCRSLLNWTKQDEETRKIHLKERLIKFVNVEELSFAMINYCLAEDLIRANRDFAKLLFEQSDFLKSKESQILCIGRSRINRNVKIVYSVGDDHRKSYPDLPVTPAYHCAIRHNNLVYCVGGVINNLMCSDKLFKLNVDQTDSMWEEMAAMRLKRSVPGAAVFKDSLVVCGGLKGNVRYTSTEVYEAELNRWKEVSALQKVRAGNRSVASGGSLYTMGGYDGKEYLTSVERLDGLDQSWRFVSSMQTPRGGFSAVCCNDEIYAIGGWNKVKRAMKSVEKYNCSADKWSYVREMNVERCWHSACVMQGKIYVVGGTSAKREPRKEIECYDPFTDSWEIVERLDDELVAHALIVM